MRTHPLFRARAGILSCLLIVLIGCPEAVPTKKTFDSCDDFKDVTSCKGKHRCFWNYDRCEEPPTEVLPHFPSSFTNLKIKQMSAGHGLCAIDENDQLWCFPDSTNPNFPTVLPHPDYKFKHVAVATPAMGEQGNKFHVCATKVNGQSICFKEGQAEPVPGPTAEECVKTIPFPHLRTVCSITKSNKIFCQSDEPTLDDDNFENYRLTRLKGAVVTNIYLYRASPLLPQAKKDNYQFAMVTNQNFLEIARFARNVWQPTWNSHQEIGKVSAFESSLCWTNPDTLGIHCPDQWFISLIRVPSYLTKTSIVNASRLTDFAITHEYFCAITELNDLLCSGDPQLLAEIVQKIKKQKGELKAVKAKMLALSPSLACYIDLQDKVNCIKIKG